MNRIHTVIENKKLKDEAKSSEELLGQTLNSNQMIMEENELLKKTIVLLEKEKARLEEHIEEQIETTNEEQGEPAVVMETQEYK